jgi:hypothetical protein
VPAAGGAVEARGAARPGAWFTFQSTVLTVAVAFAVRRVWVGWEHVECREVWFGVIAPTQLEVRVGPRVRPG